jgi:hypothetical protein
MMAGAWQKTTDLLQGGWFFAWDLEIQGRLVHSL